MHIINFIKHYKLYSKLQDLKSLYIILKSLIKHSKKRENGIIQTEKKNIFLNKRKIFSTTKLLIYNTAIERDKRIKYLNGKFINSKL